MNTTGRPLRCSVLVLAILCCSTVASSADVSDDRLPHWIWMTAERSPGQTLTLQKSFDVDAPVVSARLRLAADFTRCRVTFNGRVLVDLDEYAPWIDLDLTDDVKQGPNLLRLDCRAGEGPAAVALSLPVVDVDGVRNTIITDATWQTRDRSLENAPLRSAVSLGRVARELWDDHSIARVSAFDDYEQWRQASGADAGTDPASFQTRPGFEVELIRSAKPDEGSWVSMTFDPRGRLTIAREDKGLLRMTLSENGAEVEQVETINDSLLEVRGLLYAFDALYANANNSKGMYRLRDTNSDDQFDEVTLLREFPGTVGHGRNDLALGPDGMIYSIHGDAVELPTENIFDRTSPFRAARRGQRSGEGCLVRTDRDGKHWELVAAGLRNPFGIDFNEDGEVFTYDADHEYDMGSPWYRPTRFNQLISGGDFGWRRVPSGEWPPYFPDRAENALPVVDVGKGSPTAVKSGRHGSFPEPYRQAMFALDWAYGRILACHLSPRGAGYACRVEQFLKGRPLNVTDLDFGADGSMYLVTGGRKTRSALYRITFTGAEASNSVDARPLQQSARREFSRRARQLHHRLAELHRSNHPQAVKIAWPHLASPDPVIRQSAQVAIEHQPVGEWKQRALTETDSQTAASALLALARSGEEDSASEILQRLNSLDRQSLSAYSSLVAIRAYRLCLDGTPGPDASVTKASHHRLLAWLIDLPPTQRAPVGSGDSVQRELARLVADLQIDGAVAPLIELLKASQTQRERMHSLFVLCTQQRGWSPDRRRVFFDSLRELERTAFSGAGMPGRLKQIREHATASLSRTEREQLGDLLKPATLDSGRPSAITRAFVRKWTVTDLTTRLSTISDAGDAERGKTLFREVQCIACHRMNGRGGVLGPDLSSLAGRFSQRDIVKSIVNPSDVIAEKYRGMQVVTTDGKVFNGQIAMGGDYRSSMLRIVEDLLYPDRITEIPKSDIEFHQPSKVSPMPGGLLDTLTASDVLDLIAFLRAGELRSE